MLAEFRKASTFAQVEEFARTMYNHGDPKPGKSVLLLLDVDDTLVDTRQRRLPPTDPMLTESIRRMLDAGVRIRILTARPNNPGNYIVLSQNLAAINMPHTTRLAQHAIMTGGKIDKGTALLVEGKCTLRGITGVVFVDDVLSNIKDVHAALSATGVGRFIGVRFVMN